MVSVRFSVLFWAFLVLVAQFHFGYSLFLGHKKDLLKHKLYKIKEALLDAHDGYDEVHVHTYKTIPVHVPVSYGKYSSFGKFGSFGSYGSYGHGWPSYGYGDWGHY